MVYSDYLGLTRKPFRLDVYPCFICPREPKHTWMASPFTWVNHAGSVYKTDYPLEEGDNWHIWAVYQNGIKLTPKLSIAGIIGNGQWFFDLNTEKKLYLRGLNGENLATATGVRIQVSPMIPLVNDVPVDLKFLSFNIPTSFNGTVMGETQFKRAIMQSGLSSIKYDLESAYYGTVFPDANFLNVGNTPKKVIEFIGEFDKWADRFQLRYGEFVLLGGDGNIFLDFEDHRNFGTYFIINENIKETSIKFDIKSGFTLFQKMIPVTNYKQGEQESAFEEEVHNKFKPMLWGTEVRLPTFRLGENQIGFLEHNQDSVDAVYSSQDIDGHPSGDYEVGEGFLTFDDGIITEQDWVDVRATRCWDIDGNPAAIQLGGAFARQFMYQVVGIPLEQLPVGSFQAYDDAFPNKELIVYIDGEAQVTCREVLEKLLKSLWAVIRFKDNIYELVWHDPDNPPIAAAHIREDEIIGDIISVYTDPKELNAHVIIKYGYRPNDKIWKEVPMKLTTAIEQYRLSEPPLVVETYLKYKVDAENICVLYVCQTAREKNLFDIPATGEIINAYGGDIITIDKTRAPDGTGQWINKRLKIRNTELILMGSNEGSSKLVCEEELTAEIRDAVLANIDYVPVAGEALPLQSEPTIFYDTNTGTVNFTNSESVIIIRVWYTMTDANPDITPSSVTWNGVACTLADITNTSSKIRCAIYVKFSAATGSNLPAVANFPSNFAALAMHVESRNGYTSLGDVDKVYQASGKETSLTLTSTSGNLVLDAYMTQRSYPLAQHKSGSGQVNAATKRVPYTGSYSLPESFNLVASSKAGAASVLMKHTEEYNNVKKAMVGIVLVP